MLVPAVGHEAQGRLARNRLRRMQLPQELDPGMGGARCFVGGQRGHGKERGQQGDAEHPGLPVSGPVPLHAP